MNIVETNLENVTRARGLVVVVDVLRAFTTSCFIFKNGASKIIPISNLEEAYNLKANHPEYVLIGERKGIKPEGFDYGNSPAEIQNVDFNDKIVILTTSAGTQGIVRSTAAEAIITGAFVNAQAIYNYIQKNNPQTLSFVITDDRFPESEDFMFSKYIQGLLKDTPLQFDSILNNLKNNPSVDGFLRHPMTKNSEKDFYLSLELDRFDFVIEAKRYKNQIFLEKVLQ